MRKINTAFPVHTVTVRLFFKICSVLTPNSLFYILWDPYTLQWFQCDVKMNEIVQSEKINLFQYNLYNF